MDRLQVIRLFRDYMGQHKQQLAEVTNDWRISVSDTQAGERVVLNGKPYTVYTYSVTAKPNPYKNPNTQRLLEEMRGIANSFGNMLNERYDCFYKETNFRTQANYAILEFELSMPA